jgi:hypothetical protein
MTFLQLVFFNKPLVLIPLSGVAAAGNFHNPFQLPACRLPCKKRKKQGATMKGFKILGLFILSMALLAGCASVAHVEKDETVNFSRFKTFAWVKTSNTQSDSGKGLSDLTERNMRKAVNAELEKAGWRESKSRPDVLVSYDVLVERSVRQTSDPVYSVPVSRFLKINLADINSSLSLHSPNEMPRSSKG